LPGYHPKPSYAVPFASPGAAVMARYVTFFKKQESF
jgi:hypothetical protein